jgi:acetyl-CoA carboxylase biotin carboxylase subunit
MFKKILIANRGEIAVRVIRACRELGIGAVSVASEIDADALHARMADEVAVIGPASPLESYLVVEKVIGAAKEHGCEAIHPGYGFLAENAGFAKAVEDAGLKFIGPSSEAISLMGDKVASRERMIEAGIPVTPGREIPGGSVEDFKAAAKEIGYPVLLKAAAGGGGKGMRRVDREKDLADALDGARREAKGAFGDDTVYIEKYLLKPRHIEFQVLADHHGNTVHLFERECSIQRRHQKIVEETPSIALTPELRKKMGETAVQVAQAVSYRNAGTVEFLFDTDGSFYFLEMNTRIQVEHPVTELVAGVDLVKAQIRIAAGEELGFRQEDIGQRGHAIECRVYAEDPRKNFLPSSGPVLVHREPGGPGVRNDAGVHEGGEISVYYDPIISKLVTWGADRAEAILRMSLALKSYVILGVETNIRFLGEVVRHPEFAAGNTYTDFVGEHFPDWKRESPDGDRELILAAAAAAQLAPRTGTVTTEGTGKDSDPWLELAGFRLGG